MDENQSDPNQRDAAPFENPHGPPNYPVAPQPRQPYPQPEQRRYADQQVQSQPYGGNGQGVGYGQPGFLAAGRPPQPSQDAQAHDLPERLRMLSVGFQLGALSVAELWATHLAMFREEYRAKTGQLISDREAFEIITTPLMMALSD